jgi:hypothetical protein
MITAPAGTAIATPAALPVPPVGPPPFRAGGPGITTNGVVPTAGPVTPLETAFVGAATPVVVVASDVGIDPTEVVGVAPGTGGGAIGVEPVGFVITAMSFTGDVETIVAAAETVVAGRPVVVTVNVGAVEVIAKSSRTTEADF